MHAGDYLKRAFSSVFHEEKAIRSVVAGLTVATLATGGIIAGGATFRSDHVSVSPKINATAKAEYAQKTSALSRPVIKDSADYTRLDQEYKDIAIKLVTDTRLSEQDIAIIAADFKSSAKIKPPDYLWLNTDLNSKGNEISFLTNYLEECRGKFNASSDIKYGEAVYSCAVGKAETQSTVVVVGGTFGWMALSMLGIFGGASLGGRWEDDFKKKKKREGDAKSFADPKRDREF